MPEIKTLSVLNCTSHPLTKLKVVQFATLLWTNIVDNFCKVIKVNESAATAEKTNDIQSCDVTITIHIEVKECFAH